MLKELRAENGISQAALSEFLAISQATISKFEIHERAIPVSVQKELYSFFRLGEYHERGFSKKSEEYKDLIRQRKRVMQRLDLKTKRWSELPDEDEDLILLRQLYGVEPKQNSGKTKQAKVEYIPGIFYTK